MKTPARMLLLITGVMALQHSLTLGQTVTKDVGNFAEGQWIPSMWNAASGIVKGGATADVTVQFSGRGFQHFTLETRQPLVVPGTCRKVMVRYKAGSGYGVTMRFTDGWGRGEANGHKFEWGLPNKSPDQWQEAEYAVPQDWVMPLQITAVFVHNWGSEQRKADFNFTLGGLKVETDLTQVDPESGKLRSWTPEPNPKKAAEALKACPAVPLLQAHVNATELSSVFAGTEPCFHIVLNNWKPGLAKGRFAYTIRSNDGKILTSGEKGVEAESFADTLITFPMEQYGRYSLEHTLTLENGPQIKGTLVFAKIPAPRTLSAREKESSPYGMNIHSGKLSGDLISYLPPFIKAGLVWYRDYAWADGWLERARGDDNKFNGWPYYGKVGRHAKELGIILMPCLQGAIKLPQENNGHVEVNPPTHDWINNIVLTLNAFPDLKYWELDNEYNLRDNEKKLETRIDWKNYQLYHKRFADILDVLTGGEGVAIEEGRAGCHPERIAECVRSGSFEKIKVVNSHYYFGTEPPETCGANMNTGGGGDSGSAIARTYFDDLHDAKAAGCSDGKPRQHWVTEFAWDTLAGHIVTPYQQAAFLPRGWMVALAAGTEKCFWFGDADSAHPTFFFDGCGLFGPGPSNEPKLSLCSLAGLTHILPSPVFIGSLDAGEGSAGYLFSQYGKLVAALWMIQNDDGNKVDPQGEQVCDFLGNPLSTGRQSLHLAPLYAIGVDRESLWYQQTAYELASRHVLAGAVGDTVSAVVEVHNNRSTPLEGALSLALPAGWTAPATTQAVTLKPGETNLITLAFGIPLKTELGVKTVSVRVTEHGKALKTMPFTLQVRDPLGLAATPLGNKPGQKDVRLTVANLSASPRAGEVTFTLPAAWSAHPARLEIPTLQPGEKRELTASLDWSKGLKEGESASATFSAGNSQITQPLSVGVGKLHRLKGHIQMDGKLSDWPEANRIPNWMIGSTVGNSGAQFWMGWAPEGLYLAIKVADSQLSTLDPRAFWSSTDCLEMCLDVADNKTPRAFEEGDHQFWMMPLVKENRVYVGQWKRNNEIPSIRYDVAGVQSAARAEGDGYVMELLLPAAAIQKYAPRAGARIGLNMNLTIMGRKYDREAFWPEPKSSNIISLPQCWGSLELAE